MVEKTVSCAVHKQQRLLEIVHFQSLDCRLIQWQISVSVYLKRSVSVLMYMLKL